ncbi:ASCH domain-containing protein [Leptolyngbya ohadii]|uniref:ASCH domain-containing protein n=1 Tax=Leptolyngbya ohadii TaxID=1962290 RepID=UPI001CEDC18F|nr:ASCH domain-containing protein [Leptolyngbya ohadii]
MSEIRLLSLWQPWASFIAHGIKQYETRPWGTPYRGRIAIQAAQRKAKEDELVAICEAIREGNGTAEDIARLDSALECYFINTHSQPVYGAIVAVADLTNCKYMDSKYSSISENLYTYISDQTPLELAVGDWQPGRYAWKLENVRPLAQPIPCKGHQGLRRIQDAGVLEAIERELAYTAEIEQQLTAAGGGRP